MDGPGIDALQPREDARGVTAETVWAQAEPSLAMHLLRSRDGQVDYKRKLRSLLARPKESMVALWSGVSSP